MRLRQFSGFFPALSSTFLQLLDDNFKQVGDQLTFREFIDTTAGSVTRNLPDGSNVASKKFAYVKTDASANTVTIYSFGLQSVMGTTSIALAAQGDTATLAWDTVSQSWWKV